MNTRLTAVCLIIIFLLTSCDSAQAASRAGTPGYSPLPEALQIIAENPVLAQLAGSISAYSYVEGEIPQEHIDAILICGGRAQSAKNAQPWHFTVLHDYETVKEMHEYAARGNIVIVVSGKRENVTDTVAFDNGIAAAYIQLAAEALGYGARMLIFPIDRIEKRRAEFGIPDGYDVHCAIIIATSEHPPDAVSFATPRDPLADMVNFVR